MLYLESLNVKFWIEGGRLHYRAAKGVLTSELIAEMKAHKAAIFSFLNQNRLEGIARLPHQDFYEVSHAQRRLWILSQIEEDSAAYNLPFCFLLEGKLDLNSFAGTFEHLVNRHESLRTTFMTVDGEPRQRVHHKIDFNIRYVDLSKEPDVEEQARKISHQEIVTPFDLDKGPLLRVYLVKLGQAWHIMMLTFHHIISDGVSFSVFAREFSQIYNALHQKQPVLLPPLTIQYRDYSKWQNDLLGSQEFIAQRTYWHQKLAGDLPVLHMPLDFPRPSIQTFRGKSLQFMIKDDQKAALLVMSRKYNVSLFMMLLAIVNVLIYRYTGQEDIIIGSPIAGRNHPALENQIGFYLNMLPLRNQINGKMTFETFLKAVRQTALEAFDHQTYPFDKLVDELRLQRDLSRSPLFDVVVILQNTRISMLELQDLKVSIFSQRLEISLFDLTFEFHELDNGLSVSIEYNTDLFVHERIEGMRKHFETLLTSILTDPGQPINQLSILSPDERHKLVFEFNNTLRQYSQDKTIVDLFEAQVERRPESIAVIFRDREVSYRQLNEQANRIAHFLRDKYMIKPEDRVGVLLDRSEQLPVVLLGILKAGGAYIPVDPVYPEERIKYIIENSGCRMIITEPHYRGMLNAFCTVAVNEVNSIDALNTSNPVHPAVNDRLAYITYTSGSTGKPKGVMITHQNVVSFQCNMEAVFHFQESDSIYALTTVAFDISVLELINSLMTGMRVVMSPDGEIQEPTEVLDVMVQKKVTVLQTTPSRLKLLLEGRDTYVLSSLKVLLIGGEPLPKDLFQVLVPLLDLVTVFNVYGPTESTIWSTCKQLNDGKLNIGTPLLNESVYIISKDHLILPIGVIGEICIGGDGLSRGYHGLADMTAERFIAHPFYEGKKLYKTGDLGRWLPDGTLEYLGRNDDQVKVRGFRVELREVEHRLLQHDGVQEAVVVTYKDHHHDKQLVGYVVAKAEQTLSSSVLRAFLKKTLPDYMVPSIFVMIEKLPLTPNGKVNRKALPDPKQSGMTYGNTFVAPRNELEQQLATIWQDVLGLEKIGIEDNFLALGGHSLNAIKVVNRVQRDIGKDMRLIDIFRYQTIAGLAEVLQEPGKAKYSAIKPLDEMYATEAVEDKDIAPLTAEELEILNM